MAAPQLVGVVVRANDVHGLASEDVFAADNGRDFEFLPEHGVESRFEAGALVRAGEVASGRLVDRGRDSHDAVHFR